MNYLEIALTVIGFLLSAAAADFYRRIARLRRDVRKLEEKMTAYEMAQALTCREVKNLTGEVRRTNDTVLPTLQKLSTHVAVLGDRLKVHMNGGQNEDA